MNWEQLPLPPSCLDHLDERVAGLVPNLHTYFIPLVRQSAAPLLPAAELLGMTVHGLHALLLCSLPRLA